MEIHSLVYYFVTDVPWLKCTTEYKPALYAPIGSSSIARWWTLPKVQSAEPGSVFTVSLPVAQCQKHEGWYSIWDCPELWWLSLLSSQDVFPPRKVGIMTHLLRVNLEWNPPIGKSPGSLLVFYDNSNRCIWHILITGMLTNLGTVCCLGSCPVKTQGHRNLDCKWPVLILKQKMWPKSKNITVAGSSELQTTEHHKWPEFLLQEFSSLLDLVLVLFGWKRTLLFKLSSQPHHIVLHFTNAHCFPLDLTTFIVASPSKVRDKNAGDTESVSLGILLWPETREIKSKTSKLAYERSHYSWWLGPLLHEQYAICIASMGKKTNTISKQILDVMRM